MMQPEGKEMMHPDGKYFPVTKKQLDYGRSLVKISFSRWLKLNHTTRSGEYDLTSLLLSIQTGVKRVSAALRGYGIMETKDYFDEANHMFIDSMKASQSTCKLVSKFNEKHIEVEAEMQGDFNVVFDPLDGSGNIGSNLPMGSMFSIHR